MEVRTGPKDFYRRGAPNIVCNAVIGIAESCVPDPDLMLHDLLAGAITDCAAWVRREPGPVTTSTDRTRGARGDCAAAAMEYR